VSDFEPPFEDLIIEWPNGTLEVDKREEEPVTVLTWGELAEAHTQFYDPGQPRDERGRWTDSGGGSSPASLRKKISSAPDPHAPSVDPLRDELYRAVKEENGGVSPTDAEVMAADLAEPGGGFTYNPTEGMAATAGFSVSPYPELSRELDLRKMSKADVFKAVAQYAVDHDEVLQQEDHWFGGWHDPDTGKAWLDVSIVVDSATKARAIGAERDQIAFFDFQTMDGVTINKNATSGQGTT
jgi:hypothetical protein